MFENMFLSWQHISKSSDYGLLFVCSMGGLVVKQMLYKAKTENVDNLVKNTIGIVCFIISITKLLVSYLFYYAIIYLRWYW